MAFLLDRQKTRENRIKKSNFRMLSFDCRSNRQVTNVSTLLVKWQGPLGIVSKTKVIAKRNMNNSHAKHRSKRKAKYFAYTKRIEIVASTFSLRWSIAISFFASVVSQMASSRLSVSSVACVARGWTYYLEAIVVTVNEREKKRVKTRQLWYD